MSKKSLLTLLMAVVFLIGCSCGALPKPMQPAASPATILPAAATIAPTPTTSSTPTAAFQKNETTPFFYVEDVGENRGTFSSNEPYVDARLHSFVCYEYPDLKRETEYGDAKKESFPMSVKPNDSKIFAPGDMIAGDLYFEMTQEEVLAITGIPEAAYSYVGGATARVYLELWYRNGDVLTLHDKNDVSNQLYLYSVEIVSDLIGPRGIQVGDTVDKVISSFRINPPEHGDIIDDSRTSTLYAAHILSYDSSDRGRPIAPSGQIRLIEYDVNDDLLLVSYDHPGEYFTIEQLESGDKEYPFLYMYFLNFKIEDGHVAKYYWSSGARAE